MLCNSIPPPPLSLAMANVQTSHRRINVLRQSWFSLSRLDNNLCRRETFPARPSPNSRRKWSALSRLAFLHDVQLCWRSRRCCRLGFRVLTEWMPCVCLSDSRHVGGARGRESVAPRLKCIPRRLRSSCWITRAVSAWYECESVLLVRAMIHRRQSVTYKVTISLSVF